MKRKTRSTFHNYSISKAVIDILLDASLNVTIFDTPFRTIQRKWEREFYGVDFQHWRYNRAISYLKKVSYVNVSEKEGKKFLKLTRKGKLHALLNRLDEGKKKPASWDGRWRVIIWDIPEKHRQYRNQIRHFIRGLGFYRLQQSVFITPHELPGPAVQYLRESGLLSFIRFLRVDKLDDDKSLRRHFGLV